MIVCFGGGIDRSAQKGRHIYRQACRPAGRKTDRQTDRQPDSQTDKQTDRKTDFEILQVLYCTFLLYSKHILNALYYTVGGGDLRGTLGQKSSYFCTWSVFKCLYVRWVK
jgi:hypothetical protein